jgi:sugar lactone lactonase YvrE
VFAGVDSSNPFNPLNDVWTWTRFVIAEPFLPAGTVGLPYPGRLDAVAGTGAVTWSVSSGTLPTGLSLAQTGALTGIPQTAGRFSFTVSVTDSAGHSASRAYTVTINPSPRAGVWVSDATNSVLRAFALGASGNSAPTVTLGGSVSQLNGPDALVLDPTGGLYVANGNTASINYYAAGASGNTAPTRVISGPYTGLGVPDGLALDGAGRLYVANASASSVTVYPASANGNQVPSQTISGLLTGLRQPTGVTIDAAGRIWVTDYANNSLLEFAAGATGDAAPLQTEQPGPAPRLEPLRAIGHRVRQRRALRRHPSLLPHPGR